MVPETDMCTIELDFPEKSCQKNWKNRPKKGQKQGF